MLLELCSLKILFFHSIFEVSIPFIHACNNASNDFDQDQYSVSKRKLLIYGHVGLNPSPFTFKKANVCRASPLSILEARLHQFGLKHQDVGGAGDYFFRAVSHQLYRNPNSHGIIRAAGIQFLRDNPERFIDSNLERSWI